MQSLHSKIISTIFLFLIFSCSINTHKKTQVDSIIQFEVKGNCEMCKKRIEDALVSQRGIKKAQWNIQTKIVEVVYDSLKINEDRMHHVLSEVGHSTNKLKANPKSYNTLHSCCKYNEE